MSGNSFGPQEEAMDLANNAGAFCSNCGEDFRNVEDYLDHSDHCWKSEMNDWPKRGGEYE